MVYQALLKFKYIYLNSFGGLINIKKFMHINVWFLLKVEMKEFTFFKGQIKSFLCGDNSWDIVFLANFGFVKIMYTLVLGAWDIFHVRGSQWITHLSDS